MMVFFQKRPMFTVTAPIRGRARMSFFLSLHLRFVGGWGGGVGGWGGGC